MLPLVLLFALAAATALAWGPGNHLEFASRVYRGRRRALSKGTAELLRTQRNAYFYGNIAADIINFKGFGGHYNHCHRWTIVRDMQEKADEPSEHAFILGYLSHLAADTIAHNHFVPYHLARYARSKSLGHLYWEMRADSFVPEARWDIVARLKADATLDGLDDLVNRAVPKKALSMRANKLLFNHVLLIAQRNRWRRAVDRLHGMAHSPLEEAFLERFRRAAVGRIRLALQPHRLEELMHIDTNGKHAQRTAWKERKRMMRRFASSAKRRSESQKVAAVFLEGMESPPANGGAPHW